MGVATAGGEGGWRSRVRGFRGESGGMSSWYHRVLGVLRWRCTISRFC